MYIVLNTSYCTAIYSRNFKEYHHTDANKRHISVQQNISN